MIVVVTPVLTLLFEYPLLIQDVTRVSGIETSGEEIASPVKSIGTRHFLAAVLF